MTVFPWAARGLSALLLAACLCAATAPAAMAEPQTPTLALGRLKAGNDRFVTNAADPVPLGGPSREAAGRSHAPIAMVLSCADARVPPEFVFNTALGELFVVRSAGGVTDRAVAASLEYGAVALHAPLLVVMGHDACDVVRDAVPGAEAGSANREYLRQAIRAGTTRVADQKDTRAAVLAHVEQVINDVMAGSEPLRQAAGAGRLLVVGAYYEAASGRVIFSEPVTTATAPPTSSPHK